MIWRLLLETLFLMGILFAGGGFWQYLRAPKHLRILLADPEELRRLIGHFKYDKLVAESIKIQVPPFGTYGDTIVIWDAAHYKSLSSTRNLVLPLVLVLLGASCWLGAWYFIANVSVFLLLGVGGLPESAKNNNSNHLPVVIMNLIQWRSHDAQACAEFCRKTHPEFRNLYDVLITVQPQEHCVV
jgi:hypothetical protein